MAESSGLQGGLDCGSLIRLDRHEDRTGGVGWGCEDKRGQNAATEGTVTRGGGGEHWQGKDGGH